MRTDSTSQWSHCALAPLFELYMDIAGIRATAPGFSRCQIRPQLGDLGNLSLTAYTVRGPIQFDARAEGKGHKFRISLPAGCTGEVLLGSQRSLIEPGQTAMFRTTGKRS